MIPSMPPRTRRLLVLASALLFIFVVGGWARESLGIALDVESVRAFAESLGPAGPFLFVFVVAGRSLLWLPSQVVLVAAGLCFGTLVGGIVGGAGLMISGLFLFTGARYAGRDAIEQKFGPRIRRLLDFTRRRSGAVAFGLACGYPLSPLSPLHAAAGFTSMPVRNFVLSSFMGGAMRASIFAYFGNALTETDTTALVLPLVVFALALAVPLIFPSGRQWLRDLFTSATPSPSAAKASPAPNAPNAPAPQADRSAAGKDDAHQPD